MAKNRFGVLMACIAFDDKQTRAERFLTDKLAAVRPILKKWNDRLGLPVICGDYVTIDENVRIEPVSEK